MEKPGLKGAHWSFPIVAAGLLLLPPAPPAVVAQGVASDSKTGLGDERILFEPIDWVSAASRFEQRVTDAPSSISIVTGEEIQQYGYQTLAEVLQGIRGLYATNDHNYTTLGIRGFARPGDYNGRVLLLLDGRRLNDPVFDTASVGSEGLIDADLIDRVEIIRGPSSSIYGPNAFFAVVNVITKRGRDLSGFELSVGPGSLATQRYRASYGRRFTNGVELLVSGSYFERRGDDFYFPEYDASETNDGVAVDSDRDLSQRFFAKLSFGHFQLEGAYSDRWKRIPTGSWGTLFNDPRNETRDRQGMIDLKYETGFEKGDSRPSD